MKRNLKVVTLVCFMTAIVAIDCYSSTPLYVPDENAHPTHMFHVSGNISPPLSIGSIEIKYMTTNPACNIPNWLEGPNLLIPYKASLPFTQEGVHYDATVPLDKFTAGNCQWRPFSVDLFIKKGDIMSPFPESVWIYTPEKMGALYTHFFAQDGTDTPDDLEVKCESTLFIKEDPKISLMNPCMTAIGVAPKITMNAKEMHVNVIEGKWMNDPKYIRQAH